MKGAGWCITVVVNASRPARDDLGPSITVACIVSKSQITYRTTSSRVLRRPSHELFRQTHQILAAAVLYSLWQHVRKGTRLVRYYILGIVATTMAIPSCKPWTCSCGTASSIIPFLDGAGRTIDRETFLSLGTFLPSSDIACQVNRQIRI